MARTGGCAVCWRRVSNPMSWRCAATSRCGSAAARSKRRRAACSPMHCRPTLGPVMPPARARKARACMTGRGCGCSGRRNTAMGALAAGAPQPQECGRAGLLRRLRPRWRNARRTGRRRRLALDDRDLLCDGQGRTRPRSLRGTLLAGMASAHHACHGGGRVPRQAARRSGSRLDDRSARKQTERKESGAGERQFANRSPQLGVTVSSHPPSARPRYLPEADDARIAVPMG